MNIIAAIPARAGSKRLPGKNVKLLGGKPLIAWTIDTANESKSFTRVLVSTEDPEIAKVAKEYNAEVPWLRPIKLASDEATSIEVVVDLLNRIQSEEGQIPDAVMLLQPTSPFRSVSSIHRAIDLFKICKGESVISVSPAKTHPYWCKEMTSDGEIKPFISGQPDIKRAQDLPAVFQLDGGIYLSSVENILKEKSFYSQHTRGLIIENPYESIDIDTSFDWLEAETVLAQRDNSD